MAEISTSKKLITVGQPTERMAIGLDPGKVKILILADGVEHVACMAPQEAIQMGVSLIQCASKAQELIAEMRTAAAMSRGPKG